MSLNGRWRRNETAPTVADWEQRYKTAKALAEKLVQDRFYKIKFDKKLLDQYKKVESILPDIAISTGSLAEQLKGEHGVVVEVESDSDEESDDRLTEADVQLAMAEFSESIEEEALQLIGKFAVQVYTKKRSGRSVVYNLDVYEIIGALPCHTNYSEDVAMRGMHFEPCVSGNKNKLPNEFVDCRLEDGGPCSRCGQADYPYLFKLTDEDIFIVDVRIVSGEGDKKKVKVVSKVESMYLARRQQVQNQVEECAVCGEDENPSKGEMLSCCCCWQWFHCSCMSLDSIPLGSFFCNTCKKAIQGK